MLNNIVDHPGEAISDTLKHRDYKRIEAAS